MKKFGYFVIGILTLCMTVAQGETKVIAQNTDRGGKVKTEHYYTKKKKNVEFRDIGGGYSKVIMKEYVPEYKITKGKYRIIKKEIKIDEYNSRDKLIVEDLKGNILFQTYDMGFLMDVAIGKGSLYYSWKGEVEKGIYKVKLLSGERKLVFDFAEVQFEKIYKNWMYLKAELENNPNNFLFFNLKNGKYKEAEHCLIKGKTLYYSIRQAGDERKLYRCNFDFSNLQYLGKYKSSELDSIYPITMVNYDGKYVYFELHNLHHNMIFKIKAKFIKNTEK